MTQPYTYLITEKATGKRYYGVRFAKNCAPSDLGTKYFSSSKYLKPLAENNPTGYVFEIRRCFSTGAKARSWEHRVLHRMHVKTNPNWYNRTDNQTFSSEDCAKGAKGKPGVNLGKHASDETKRKMSLAHKGACAGNKHPMFGKHHSDATKRKLQITSSANVGWHHSPETIAKQSAARIRWASSHRNEAAESAAHARESHVSKYQSLGV